MSKEIPRCPVCGEEMEFLSIPLSDFWRCKNKGISHTFFGPGFDKTGEKTIAMISEIRQEARIEELEAKVDKMELLSKTIRSYVDSLGLWDSSGNIPESLVAVSLMARRIESLKDTKDFQHGQLTQAREFAKSLEDKIAEMEAQVASMRAECDALERFKEMSSTAYRTLRYVRNRWILSAGFSGDYSGSTVAEAVDASEKAGL